jgi:hypothetical protein
MYNDEPLNLLSRVTDLEIVRMLLADLHDDLDGKVARYHQLADLSLTLGSGGTMLPGGQVALAAWTEARTNFVHGNYVATVLLCQSLAEQVLAAHLSMALESVELPSRISFHETLRRCVANQVLSVKDSEDLRHLMELRNPLSHYRNFDDPSNLSRRSIETRSPEQQQLLEDATFGISVAFRLLALPAFRLGA